MSKMFFNTGAVLDVKMQQRIIFHRSSFNIDCNINCKCLLQVGFCCRTDKISKSKKSTYLCRMRILMVCLGNICRSPLAEGILQQKIKQAGLTWTVDSAGTNGYHDGEAPHHLSQKVARLNGIDICQQVSRRFVVSDLEKFDLIFAMAADVITDMKHIAGNKYDEKKKCRLLLDILYPDKKVDVPDPWYGGEDGYHKVYALIDEACEKIVAAHIPNVNV